MAYRLKPEDEEFVEVPAHAGPPTYQQMYSGPSSGGTTETDALLRALIAKVDLMQDKLTTQTGQLEKMTIELKHVKFNMAKTFIVDIIKTEEFTRSLRSCMDSKGNVDAGKFAKMVEGAEPAEPGGAGNLPALIKKQMGSNGLTNEELEDIVREVMVTYKPPKELPEEVKKRWTGFKIGVVGTLGIGTCILALFAILNPALLGGLAIAAGAAATCGGLTLIAGVAAHFMK